MTLFKSTLPLIRDTEFANSVAGRLCARLCDIKREGFADALWVGGGDAQALKTHKTIENLHTLPFPVEGDAGVFPFPPASLDLIVVNGTLGRVNDLPGALIQMRMALKPDGVFLCAFAGGETLFELRESLLAIETSLHGGAAARVHPMIDLQNMAALMQRAGFALPVVDAEINIIFYNKFKKLLRDIKQSGKGLALTHASKKYVGRAFWPSVENHYRARHTSPDGLLRASIEMIYAIGWGPAESQPKPLKPGSAKNSMIDALE